MKLTCKSCSLEREIRVTKTDRSLRLGERTELVQDLRADLSKVKHTCRKK